MKKIKLVAIFASLTLLLTACSADVGNESSESNQSNNQTEKNSVVVSSFVEYDWLMQVLGDNKANFDVTLLMDTGVDMHSYEPSVEDISTISTADLFIYNGGVSYAWVDDVIGQAMNEDLKTVNLMETLGDAVLPEVAVEGMQIDEAHDHEENHVESEEEHDHDHEEDHAESEEVHDHDHDEDHAESEEVHDHDHEEDHAESEEVHDHDHEEDHAESEEVHDHDHDDEHGHDDEHIWLSLNNAMKLCNELGDIVAELDPENADEYKSNTDAYISTLQDLDQQYETAIAEAERDTLIFADRFPFIYMMEDYDVNYYAAFQGCSAETEASFETITFLSGKVDELDANSLLIIDNGLIDLANTINNNSEDKDSEILVLNSIQSVSQEDIDAGASYYQFMVDNLEIIKQALSN